MPVTIRPEIPADYPSITEIYDLAFGRPGEGKLVENLRKNPKFVPELSLVAKADGRVVGHILFFPIKIKSAAERKRILFHLLRYLSCLNS
jgi:putative acetyltransferase